MSSTSASTSQKPNTSTIIDDGTKTDRACQNSNSTEPEPEYVHHEVVHFKQQFAWDCGLSCVLMLLNASQRQYFLDNFNEICTEEGFGSSTWTIDLCYLLKRFNIKHCMYSTMMGVNEAYAKMSYYDSIMSLDKERVQQRFEQSAAAGVDIREGCVRTRQLVAHLARRGPAIVLVDAGLLACDLCKHNKLRVEFRRRLGGSYAGHYILVVGYNKRGGRLLYRDPALAPRLCAARPAALAAARAAPGTDHDVVLVQRPSS
ncbi:protein GUCD1 isoform X2 [Pectinophora gossypiella]|uniref:protein GUCD1 isoform X2 n=1 Tax=Pectinophora gossypiella TaxID=13191 RepID=UPI00214DF5B1|nr:protein GUCD1 isoform X2 [Pectinophora gossypiella]